MTEAIPRRVAGRSTEWSSLGSAEGSPHECGRRPPPTERQIQGYPGQLLSATMPNNF
jgi:hypothetical protein